jgi:transcriptional regulator with XRE-family HTH domain
MRKPKVKPNTELFPIRLRSIRVRRGWNQDDLARELGISKGSIGNWESGKNMPTPPGLSKLAELLGVSIDFLLGGNSPGSTYGTSPAAAQDNLVAAELRARIHGYLDRVLDLFGGDLDRLTWAHVHVQKQFPLPGRDTPVSLALPSAEVTQWSAAAEGGLAIARRVRSRSRAARGPNAQTPPPSRGASPGSKAKQSPPKPAPK